MRWPGSSVRITLGYLLGTCVWLSACAAPPQKEMSRAEGAIEAARAAGAENYAAEELGNAQRALERSRAAVEERDYRQALSQALDAFEQAELAAGTAATQKAKAQREYDARLAAATAALDAAKAALELAIASRVPDGRLKVPRATLTSLEQTLQEARSHGDETDLRPGATRLEALADEAEELAATVATLTERSSGGRRPR